MRPEPDYVFRDLHREDFPLLALWLAEPHIARWWEAADIELAAIERSMGSEATRPMIVELEGKPIAYLQTYDPHREPGHPYRDQPAGTLGMDLAIGPPELTGRGHGSGIAAELAAQLLADGTKRVVIDPDPENRRAIRAYEKAGFRFIERRHSIYGPAHFMALDTEIEETDMP